MPYLELAIVLLCVALSILFSGSETALNALGSHRLEKLIEKLREAGKRPRFLSVWRDQRNQALTCILIGNNVVNITASALVTVSCERIFRATDYAGMAVPTAIAVTTFLILTFGEIVPKTFAQNNAERFALVVRFLLDPIHRLLHPFTWIFVKLSEWFIRRSGGRVNPAAIPVTEEDIEDHIEKAAQQGNLDEDQKKLLNSVFQFDDTLVQEVMKPRTELIALSVETKLEDILSTVKESNYSRYPIYQGDLDHITGILHVRNLLTWFGKPQQKSFELEQFLRKPCFVPTTKNIRELLREMQASRDHLAIVVDEHGGTAGLVTVEDIIEEVFGEIYDEHDDQEASEGEDLVLSLSETSWEVEAKVSIRDLEDALQMDIADEETYSTLAGFILAEVGSIPEANSIVHKNELNFTVLEADSRRVIRVRIDHVPTVILENKSA